MEVNGLVNNIHVLVGLSSMIELKLLVLLKCTPAPTLFQVYASEAKGDNPVQIGLKWITLRNYRHAEGRIFAVIRR